MFICILICSCNKTQTEKRKITLSIFEQNDKNYKTVDLACKNLSELPENLEKCATELVTLDLSHNAFTNFPDLSMFTQLKNVNLDNNQLKIDVTKK